MALEDRAEKLKQQADDAAEWAAKRPAVIAAWQQSVSALYDEIRSYLSDLVSRGSITIASSPRNMTEQALGSYQTEDLEITFGSKSVVLAPQGRMIAGAVGRVDMVNRATRKNVVIAHRSVSATDPTLVWQMQLSTPAPGNMRLKRNNQPAPPQKVMVTLSRDDFRNTLDQLLG